MTGETTITAEPRAALRDESLTIAVTGCPPGAAATIRARMAGGPGMRWEAWAEFAADAMGRIDVATARPFAGTYADADPLGLLWSMVPTPAPDATPPAPPPAGALPTTLITLTVKRDGQAVAEATIERRWTELGVRRTPVREGGLSAVFCQPEGPGPHPGLLLLGGSEGGLHEPDAALLAARGYATLALAYFRAPGVSPDLVDVPLEYFGTALDWLAARPGVRADRLGVMGGSRGGELALLLGATFPAIRTVVSTLGSGLIMQGIGGHTIAEMVDTARASWTYRGQRLPYLPSRATPAFAARLMAGEPIDLGEIFRAALDAADADTIAAATIPVERIGGPVLLISAGDDRTWPTEQLSTMAEVRLRRHGHPHPVEHHRYPAAGHGIIPPPHGPTTILTAPLPGGAMILGGTAATNAHARADAWHQTLAFLGRHLGEE